MIALSGGKVSLATGCKSIALVSSLLIVFPSRLSDLIKPVYLLERAGLNLSAGFSILFFERTLDVFVLLGMLAILILGQSTVVGDDILRSATFLGVLGFALIVLIGALAVRPRLLKRAAGVLPLLGFRRSVTQFVAALSDTASAPVIARGGVLSLLAWANSYLIFYVYLVSLNTPDAGISIDAMSVLLVFVAGALGLFVTVTPGGIGTYELAIALALSTFGIPLAEGLVHGLILRVIVLFPNLVLLVYIIAYDGLGLRKLFDRISQMRRSRIDEGDAS
jgi:uncharacterized protein (TIRG00374 family)